jgi:hypothetical protein
MLISKPITNSKNTREKVITIKKNTVMSMENNLNEIYKNKIGKSKVSYKYDSSYPGTAPPGMVEDNFPLSEVLQLNINNLNVQEFSRDQHCGVIRGYDESILDWLEKKNRVKPREKEDLRDDLVEKNQILIEDDFDFENGEETLENFFGQPNSNLSDFI